MNDVSRLDRGAHLQTAFTELTCIDEFSWCGVMWWTGTYSSTLGSHSFQLITEECTSERSGPAKCNVQYWSRPVLIAPWLKREFDPPATFPSHHHCWSESALFTWSPESSVFISFTFILLRVFNWYVLTNPALFSTHVLWYIVVVHCPMGDELYISHTYMLLLPSWPYFCFPFYPASPHIPPPSPLARCLPQTRRAWANVHVWASVRSAARGLGALSRPAPTAQPGPKGTLCHGTYPNMRDASARARTQCWTPQREQLCESQVRDSTVTLRSVCSERVL